MTPDAKLAGSLLRKQALALKLVGRFRGQPADSLHINWTELKFLLAADLIRQSSDNCGAISSLSKFIPTSLGERVLKCLGDPIPIGFVFDNLPGFPRFYDEAGFHWVGYGPIQQQYKNLTGKALFQFIASWDPVSNVYFLVVPRTELAGLPTHFELITPTDMAKHGQYFGPCPSFQEHQTALGNLSIVETNVKKLCKILSTLGEEAESLRNNSFLIEALFRKIPE